MVCLSGTLRLLATLSVATAISVAAHEERVGAKTDEVAAVAAHSDPQMAAVIAEVRKNEPLYQNLESVVVTTSKLAPVNKQWSMVRSSQRAHTILQGELFYFRGDETRTFRNGATTQLEHASQYDGEKTLSI